MHHGEGITEGEKQRIKLLQRALSQKPVNIAVILTEAHYRGLPDALRGRCWRAILNVQDSDVGISFYRVNLAHIHRPSS